MTTTEPDPNRRRAGVYGFSRFEVVALLMVVVIAVGIGLVQWWHRQTTAATSPWVIESVLTEASRPQGHGAADSARSRDGRQTATPETVVDVNVAPAAELVRLPGIGPVLADRIIAERERGGPFQDLADLQRVPGIGSGRTRALAGWVKFSSPVVPDTVGGP